MSADDQLGQALLELLNEHTAELRVALPGRVERYHDADDDPRVDVVPMVRAAPGEDLPVIPDVPVTFPSGDGGDSYLSFPLRPGDTGELIFHDMDLREWRRTGELRDAADQGRHSLASATFRPGLRPSESKIRLASGATILAGKDLRLGSVSATHPVLRGNDFQGHLNIFLGVLSAWAQALAVATGVPDTITAAANTFSGQVTGDLSAGVKVP